METFTYDTNIFDNRERNIGGQRPGGGQKRRTRKEDQRKGNETIVQRLTNQN